MPQTQRGRAAGQNTPNRFERLHLEPVEMELAPDDRLPLLRTVFLKDSSHSILAKNESPDLPFRYSLNPYRGCEHGCIYCYARPSHEYLGFSAGLDFESRIMVKLEAPRLLAEALGRKSWVPQVVALSGNTDCYQPVERQLRLTRMCLEVFLEYRNPVTIVTKNSLILRDLEILKAMARYDLVQVMISVTSLNPAITRAMEPRTSSPSNRLEAISALADAGIPVGVNAAPVIPGMTDEEIPGILSAAAARGASSAGYILVRLPGPVRPLFVDWLRREFPDRSSRILNRIRDTRDGELSDARFATRMTGQGSIAAAIRDLFEIHAARCGLKSTPRVLSTQHFTVQPDSQLDLFTL
jgi:DNA repair photolyase